MPTLFQNDPDPLSKRGLRGRFASKKPAQAPGRKLAASQVMNANEAKRIPSSKQLKHLPRLLSSRERIIGVIGIALIVTALSLLAFDFVRSNRIIVPAVGGEYTEGLVGSPQLINPLYALTSDVDTDLSKLVYSGLMRYDSSTGLEQDLASWYEISSDGLEYTFTLREDAMWHDGHPVLADDVIFTYSAIQNSEYRSPLRVSFAGVNMEQVDKRTVRFVLDEPFGPFLSLLTVGILPSHLWGNVSPQNAPLSDLNIKPIGSGPYQFEKLVKDSNGNIRSYSLVTNTKFYLGTPSIETLTFKFYTDSSSAVEALKNRNIEGIAYASLEDIVAIDAIPDVSLELPSLPQYTAVFFNEESSEILKSDTVREALALGTNKDAIVQDVLQGFGTAVHSFILPGMEGYTPTLGDSLHDTEAAKNLLEQDEWILEEGAAVRTKEEIPLVIELTTLDSTDLVATAKALQSQWKDLGIAVNIVVVNQADFQNIVLVNREYEMILSGELYGIDEDPYPFWHSSQTDYPGLNLSQYADRTADEYIETARSTTNTTVRAEAFTELQKLVLDDRPAIFLYQPNYLYPTSEKIENRDIQSIIIPADRFSRIFEWYTKTKSVFGLDGESSELEPSSAKNVDNTLE